MAKQTNPIKDKEGSGEEKKEEKQEPETTARKKSTRKTTARKKTTPKKPAVKKPAAKRVAPAKTKKIATEKKAVQTKKEVKVRKVKTEKEIKPEETKLLEERTAIEDILGESSALDSGAQGEVKEKEDKQDIKSELKQGGDKGVEQGIKTDLPRLGTAPFYEKAIEEEGKTKIKGRPIGLYRKIALSFILLTIVLLAVIAYFSFVKVDIILIPNQERISNNLIFDIYDKDGEQTGGETALVGVVKKVEVELTEEYPASRAEVIGEETVGKVTIINNYTQGQPLVATTRLLSPDNKLFRIKETTDVPAGETAEVDVYADEPGPDMAIEPTTFTIPGLWAGLQDKIYAKSEEAFVFQKKERKFIVQEDIDSGLRGIKQKLLSQIKADINEEYKEYDQIIFMIDEDSVDYQIDGEVGEERKEFPISIKASVVVVAFNDKLASGLAKQKFISSLADSKELISFDEENIIYSLHEYNIDEGRASVNVTFDGKVSLKDHADVIEIDKILGLSEEQLGAYLYSLPEIAGFEIKFFPSFINKVPTLVDRVNIELKK